MKETKNIAARVSLEEHSMVTEMALKLKMNVSEFIIHKILHPQFDSDNSSKEALKKALDESLDKLKNAEQLNTFQRHEIEEMKPLISKLEMNLEKYKLIHEEHHNRIQELEEENQRLSTDLEMEKKQHSIQSDISEAETFNREVTDADLKKEKNLNEELKIKNQQLLLEHKNLSDEHIKAKDKIIQQAQELSNIQLLLAGTVNELEKARMAVLQKN